MNKQKIEIIITLGLIVVFIAAWGNSIKILKQRSRVSVPVAFSPATPFQTDLGQAKTQDLSLSEGEKEHLEWVRCPFSGKIYSGSTAKAVDLKLTGIFKDEKGLHALINDMIVQAGDVITPYKIMKINPDSVILNDGQEDIEIKLAQ